MVVQLPKSVRIATGALSPGISDRRLQPAVRGKVIVVTGASSGVGWSTALRLARAGAIVLAVARRADQLERLQARAAAENGVVHPFPCDISDLDACAQLIDRILAEHGRVDVFVNNAGRSIRRWLTESVDRFDNFEDTALVNYLGPVRLIMSLLPSMRVRGAGHIVNVSTAGVHAPPVEWTAYIATKAAFSTWLRGAGPELRADGITTSTIHLQLVMSPMLGPFRIYRYAQLIGMTPEEAAGMVCRAIVDRPMAIRPWWERAGVPLLYAVENTKTSERVKTLYVRATNPAARPAGMAGAALERAEDLAHFADDLVVWAGEAARARPHRVLPPPTRVPQTVAALRGGVTIATLLALFAARFPDTPAVIDDDGEISAAELHRRVEKLAAAMRQRWNIGRGSRVGVLCRNHRGFVEAIMAGARLSADVVPLNYGFAGPQLGSVLDREHVDLLCYDAEFQAALANSGFRGPRLVVRSGSATPLSAPAAAPSVDDLIAQDLPPVRMVGYGATLVILTGGTTGVPKGAPRRLALGELIPYALRLRPRMLGVLTEIPRFTPIPRIGNPIIVAPPLHHAYGLGAMLLACALGAPMILRRTFDAQQTLADIERYSVNIACLVPAMLKRIMDLPPEIRRDYNCMTLDAVPCGAAPLPPRLGTEFMDEFGDVLFNGYGSTEVGPGALATPADLRAAPGTVGYPPKGLVDIRIVDADGRDVRPGDTGRIVNRNPVTFLGYSGGGHKPVLPGGWMDSGDVGHFDSAGRLFIDGRSDDMILSGGENVFPQEVEELLQSHPAVADAGAVGVPDPEFGQRLAAFVVRRPGAEVTDAELQAYVKSSLANYKVPREVVFTGELPRSTSGKLRRAQLLVLAETAGIRTAG
ncbi:SDR family NAD(P)-dependent oxidoreductase [Nocardia uniformis]|uniref:SDR family NAD(P)-dependent oxidoreductase n=1 Tax=Nocardia uniformis TaxID=53432 RepID=A0A849C559_9NOCA|nr:SDR family NAD(P)-dependent oxidoreductase [Nocardia uniformis]NNH70947.1 SDR family NAD(P)-dependent oxidoreductase [Nocardia uniformis]